VPHSILIADDNATVRNAVRAMLERHPGWQVCAEASNGNEAISMAQKHMPDLIIMDFAMPVLDGLKASHEISKVMPGVRIVLQREVKQMIRSFGVFLTSTYPQTLNGRGAKPTLRRF